MLLVAGIVWAFLWAVRSGQFDDLEGPAHQILMDDDEESVMLRRSSADGPPHADDATSHENGSRAGDSSRA